MSPSSTKDDIAKKRFKIWRWPVWVVLFSLVWIAVTQHDPMRAATHALAQGDWLWMIPVALLQAVYYWLYAILYWSAFKSVGVESKPKDLLPILLGSIAVSVAAPAGTAVGAALFIDDAVARGQSGPRAAAGTLLVLIAELIGVAVISVFGLNLLLHNPAIAKHAITWTALLIAFTVLLIVLVVIALAAPELVRVIAGWCARAVNTVLGWVKRPPALSDAWVEKTAGELTSAAMAMRDHPWQVAATMFISLVMFGVMLLSLAFCFPAFGQPISSATDWSTLSAGFVVGMLLWIVSPTPQGIGLVEAGMAMTFAAFHISHQSALSIALTFRAFAFWLPLLCGVFCLRELARNKRARPGKTESNNVRALAVMIGLMGLVNLISAVHPALQYRVHILHHELYFPLELTHGSRLASALAGFFLIVLARGLFRRKRAAWVLSVGTLFVSAILHLIKGLDYEEASLATILMIWLVTQQSKFYASSDPPSVWQGIRVLLAAAGFTLAYGVIGLYILDHQFRVNYGLWAAIKQTVAMFTEFDPGLVPISRFGIYFRDSIYGVGAATMTYALLMILRPVLYRAPISETDTARAREIVTAHGQTPLARYALFDDKCYHFTPGGSVVAYTVIGRTALTLGDPIGPSEDAEAAIVNFSEYCRRNDWRVGFYQTLPDNLAHYNKAGYHALCIGRDAIVTLADFTVLGGSNKQIRWSLNRFTKMGYRVEVLSPPHSAGIISKLKEVSDDWLSSMHSGEKRFSLGWFNEEYLQQCRIMVVLDPDLQITAFTNILPVYGNNETTIDLMRRRRDIETGTMEFLFVKLLEWARDEGIGYFNLGLSPLSGVGDAPEDPAVERALNYVYHHMNQFYSFKGLHTFKSKFRPEWHPRYLIYPSPASLPNIALTIIHANSGGTYIKALAATMAASIADKRERKKAAKGETPLDDKHAQIAPNPSAAVSSEHETP